MVDEDQRQWNRKGAVEEIENLKILREVSWEQHSHSYKWLMASLLALNGGVCLAVFGEEWLAIPDLLVACGAFVVGITSALLVAVFGQRSIQHSLLPIQKLIGYWLTVTSTGERDESDEAKLSSELAEATSWAKGARVAGWISALSFLVGVLSIGFALSGHGLFESDLGRIPE